MRRIEAAESLPPDLQREYADLSDRTHHLRHRVRSYPAVRIGGRGEALGGQAALADAGRTRRDDAASLPDDQIAQPPQLVRPPSERPLGHETTFAPNSHRR
jgi:hypothetical protein